MKPAPLFLLCAAFSWHVQCAGSPFPPDAALLAHWIAGQQFSQAGSPGCGGLKIGDGVAVRGIDGTPYCRVSPYTANLGVLGLLRTGAPECGHVAELWIDWYFAHLNPQSAPEGVPCDHFYQADGAGETTCVKPGDPSLCQHNDATDSAAATFFSVLWAAHQAGVPAATFDIPPRRRQLENLAEVLLKLQQADGLCWAKKGYRVKYLEDNSEVSAGLRALADLEQNVFNDPGWSAFYRAAARRVQAGILKELYDPRAKLFLIAKFEDGHCLPANLDVWYPDTQAQAWPCLFGVLPATDPRARGVMAAVDAHWQGGARPDWAAHPEQVDRGWIEAGHACAALLANETNRVRIYVQAVKRLKFPASAGASAFAEPFSVADAGWLLQILAPPPAR
ncbi:MAG TPA: hypothetical protein VMA35_09510 [Candidatus Sulfopaludibacter sp.]|nr:hypothetical protein [Candidatus Sulfopaludibacter sp.]